MMAFDILAWTADADMYCPGCAADLYPGLDEGTARDAEGNEPHPVFADQEDEITGDCCGSCHEPLVEVEEGGIATCPACNGIGLLLGQLGDLTHYRCRCCGCTFDGGEV